MTNKERFLKDCEDFIDTMKHYIGEDAVTDIKSDVIDNVLFARRTFAGQRTPQVEYFLENQTAFELIVAVQRAINLAKKEVFVNGR